MINIPKNEVILKENKDNISLFLYGSPMSGKTHFANTFPEPLFFNTDGNTQDINKGIIDLRENQEVDYKDQKIKINKWPFIKYFVEFLDEYIEEIKKQGYKTLVFDTIDHIYDYCREFILEKQGLQDEMQDTRPYSPILREIKREFSNVIKALIDGVGSKMNLILIGYDATETYQKDMVSFNKISPLLKTRVENSKGVDTTLVFKGIESRLSSVCLLAAVNVKDTNDNILNKRVLYAYDNEAWVAGNRFKVDSPIIDPTYQKIKEAKEAKEAKGKE